MRTCRRQTIRDSGIAVFCDWQEPNFWPAKSHREIQILCALKSASWEATVENRHGFSVKVVGSENQVWILPPGVMHSIRWRRKAGLIVIHVASSWVERAVAVVSTVSVVDPLAAYTLRDPLIGGLVGGFTELCSSSQSQNAAHVLAVAGLLAIRVLRANGEGLAQAQIGECSTILGPETKARVVSFIEGRLTEQITIPALAHEARLSISHFTTVFKATTGLTPEQYILRSRLWRARALIETGTRTIGEIAHATGFADHSHLTVQFKRMFGSPPKAFYPAVRQL